MTVLAKILLYIWELPQNIIGFIISRFAECKISDYVLNNGASFQVYFSKLNPATIGEAVTLGEYIIVDTFYYDEWNEPILDRTVNHEYGHVRQSRILGWFYLLIIGIPSFIHALLHYKTCRDKKYGHFYTERWADKLGGISYE